MRTGLTISAISHTVLLLWGIITFTGKPYTAESTEAMPIDIISAKDFSQLTAGTKNAPKTDTSKPMVDQVAENKPTEEKRDLIAEAIKRDQAKKPDQKKAEAKNPVPPKKEKEQPKFDPRKVEALLDKRQPQRVAAVGETLNKETSL